MAWSLTALLGQEDTVARLNREVAAGRLAHAYMFEGSRGVGRLSLARGLAARLFCLAPSGDGGACGECRPCLMLAHGNHPDYLELPRDPAELRIGRFLERSGGSESVDHQPLLPFLRLKPVEGGWRVAVVPDAERMRPESANAFLKTLEEPPGQTLILLTVGARDRLPATIASRCRRMGLRPLASETLAAELERRGVASGAEAVDLAVTAEGSPGVALELARGEVIAFWRWLETEAFAHPGAVGAQRLADGWLAYGGGSGDNAGKRKNALDALDLTALAVRRKLRSGLEPETGARVLDILWNGAEQIIRNVRPDLVLLSTAFEVMAALRS